MLRSVKHAVEPPGELAHEPVRFDPQELLTPDEVCGLLKMKRTWFYAEVGRGALHPLKLGRSTRVRRSDLEAYLTKLEQAG